jgi:hypothetical protein
MPPPGWLTLREREREREALHPLTGLSDLEADAYYNLFQMPIVEA